MCIFACSHTCICDKIHMYVEVKGQLSLFCHVGPREQTQNVSFNDTHLHPLSCLTDPRRFHLNSKFSSRSQVPIPSSCDFVCFGPFSASLLALFKARFILVSHTDFLRHSFHTVLPQPTSETAFPNIMTVVGDLIH